MSNTEVKWTDAQLEAIDARGNNVLVSAAAGSGKTTVLVERVIRMLTRAEDPVEIDRLLVVTFTRAAARSMREKIYKAIKEKLQEEPDNLHLRKQLMKVHTANISTIDSMCADIVRENFQDIDIDPGFRMADEAELKLLKQDVLKDILEKHYSDPEENFQDLVEYYTEKNTAKLEDLVLKLFDFAESDPEPAGWFEKSLIPYLDAKDLMANYEFEEGDWFCRFRTNIEEDFYEIALMAQRGLLIARSNYGPFAYEPYFMEILDFLSDLNEQPFDNRKGALEDFLEEWKRSPSIKKTEPVDKDLKELAKNLRSEIKKKLGDLKDTYFYQDLESMYNDMASCIPVVTALLQLTMEFAENYKLVKKDKKIADFSDIAHYALEVLVQHEDGRPVYTEDGGFLYTEVADQMAQYYEELIVDEYQDTNLLQDSLIKALSGERFGKPNVFMVGDVKQSIYGFRMACPGLFIDKLNSYKADPEQGQLIMLNENFRSRKEILAATNNVFDLAMVEEVGGIKYKEDDHGLKYGNGYEDGEPEQFNTEIIMIEEASLEAKAFEAHAIADRIEALVKEGRFDYKDMVILSRSANNPVLEKVLSERRIPVIKASKKGFFDSFEITLVLNLLAVIDNPYQDIPMAAVMMSPLCNVSANELALIKTQLPEKTGSLYEGLSNYRPLAWFVEKLKEWQSRQSYMELCDFIDYVLTDSGLYEILIAMPNGESRKANLDFLKDKAMAFANGPYTGLFHFIRFVKAIRKADIDYGQAQVISKEANAVQMMTIHASKGLEFPVVFLVNAGKKANETDLRAHIILDRDLGIGLEARDVENRIIKKTVLMEIIKAKKKTEQYAEELRLLYVAMTRAKEKLIISGADRSLTKHMVNWETMVPNERGTYEGFEVLKGTTYLDILGMTLLPSARTDVTFVYPEKSEEAEKEAAEIVSAVMEQERILSLLQDDIDTTQLYEELHYIYPYGKAARIQAKISPSQLEKEPSEKQMQEEIEWKDPAVLNVKGVDRGNAYHLFFELLDYSRTDDLDKQLEEFTTDGKISETYAKLIDLKKIRNFLSSEIGSRMKAAFDRGVLHREEAFLMGEEVDINHTQTLTGIEPTSDLPDEEILLVQGIIDAYFEEDGKLILVDYKTDRNAEEAQLIERYKPQQDVYARALERKYGKPVDEKYLYSVHLDKEIRL